MSEEQTKNTDVLGRAREVSLTTLQKAKRWQKKVAALMTWKRKCLALLVAFVFYVSSYMAWSRWFPAMEGEEDRVTWYTFVSNDPDWEYGLFHFYYPLIRLDAALGGRVHRFDVVYL